MAAEVERERLFPLLVRRLEGEAAAAAGIVDEDVDAAEALQRRIGDALRRLLGEEVLLDDDQLVSLSFELLEQVAAARSDGELHTLLRQSNGDRAADADARARDERAFPGDAEIH